MKNTRTLTLVTSFLMLCIASVSAQKQPVDYVNPYIGNISHLLVPTYPTVHLPNSMLRVYPERGMYTDNFIDGLPLIVTSHRGRSAFKLSPYQGELTENKGSIKYYYDNEVTKPYFYSVDLDEYDIHVEFAPSTQAGIYKIDFKNAATSSNLLISTRNGEIQTDGKFIKGYQELNNDTKVYIYLETDISPVSADAVPVARGTAYSIKYPQSTKSISVRYGVSFISAEQAEKNLKREIKDYNLQSLAGKGRQIWNETLGKIKVTGGTEDQKVLFYTSLYRTYERMICISEDGKYFSAFDGNVHDDNGIPFYTDDWIWDTYLATHPLRVIIEPEKESAMINSHLRMASQMERPWMPNFPEVDGDSRRMNANHGVSMVIDAYNKGLRSFDLNEAYIACKGAITEKTLAPWSAKPAGVLDQFYKDHGYFPVLAKGEKETVPEVHSWERRQAVAVTLGTVFDEWCLGMIAGHLGKRDEAKYFTERAYNYRKVLHPETKFFHGRDTFGLFMENLDYRFPPAMGARDVYDENTGYIFRFNVQHNIADLVNLLGGKQAFADALEDMYDTPLGKSRYDFYSMYPDHTGNVGQFSMGNEPCMHIAYLYNYAGQPWKTQKRIRNLLDQWFRNDLMGVPGDEDGGGLTAFVVFSMMGFYPVTPGLPMYVIGSPVFENASFTLTNGKTFEVVCSNYSPDHKYIQSATFNGKQWNKSWFSHDELMQGGKIEFVMGKHPNKQWAASDDAIPPSFSME